MSEAFDRIPRATDQQIQEAYELMVQKRFIGHWMIDPSMVPSVFMPIALGALADFTTEELDQIAIWEDLDEAGPVSINGNPTFTSMRIWYLEDVRKAVEIYTRVAEAAKGVLQDWKEGK